MGRYYDYINAEWKPSNRDRQLTRIQERILSRRQRWIEDLMVEIQMDGFHNPDATLYASLLVRALTTSDELLAQRYGKQVADLSGEPEKTKPGRASRSRPAAA
jgi:hypothetical protein